MRAQANRGDSLFSCCFLSGGEVGQYYTTYYLKASRESGISLICLNKKKCLSSVFKVPPEGLEQASHLYFTYILMLLQN